MHTILQRCSSKVWVCWPIRWRESLPKDVGHEIKKIWCHYARRSLLSCLQLFRKRVKFSVSAMFFKFANFYRMNMCLCCMTGIHKSLASMFWSHGVTWQHLARLGSRFSLKRTILHKHAASVLFLPPSFFFFTLLSPIAFLQLVVSDDLLYIICFIGLFSPVCCLC